MKSIIKSNKKAFLQISYQWIFALVAGGVILFLAIYGATKVIETGETQIDAKTGRNIGILLNPLESGPESFTKPQPLQLPVDTRIYNDCDNMGEFGHQKISISQKSYGKWTDTKTQVSFPNKYIFSESPVEGKTFIVFSKPYNLPFKVASLIYLIPFEEDYCFSDAPEDIERDINNINAKNLKIGNCTQEDIKVCFSSDSDCDMRVDVGGGVVEKREGEIYFQDESLMYGAIFSSVENYECQVKRIMQRIVNLVEIYNDKAQFISPIGCNSNLRTDLNVLKSKAGNLTDSHGLYQITSLSKDIQEENKYAVCSLW